MEKKDKGRTIPINVRDEDDSKIGVETPADEASPAEKPQEAESTEPEKDPEELYDRLLRLNAEFDNYKKRSARQMDDFRKYANESLIKDLLPVVDNLERAMASKSDLDNGGKQLLDGVVLTHKEIQKLLEKYGANAIEAEGQPFDPAYHQALMTEPSSLHPEQTVITEMQKGYMLRERLLRPSLVVVSSGPENKQE